MIDICNNCLLPTSGQRVYACPTIGCKMTPHWCHLYQSDDSYRVAWDEGRGPGQITSNGNRPKPKAAKPRTPCSRNRADAYSGDDADFALALCIRCDHYDDDSDHCQATTICKRVAKQLSRSCSERVRLPNHGCPLMRW